MFYSFGCSYTYGASLYYHEWLKDKPEGYQIPYRHDSWVEHENLISSTDHEFRLKNRFVGLLSKELNMSYYGAEEVGGNNTQIIDSSFRQIKTIQTIHEDKVVDRKVEFMLVQLSHPRRDYEEPTDEELKEWSRYKGFDEHYDEHTDGIVQRLDDLKKECDKINVKLYVFSTEDCVGVKLIDKSYFIPIYVDGIEYNSIEHLKKEKNSSQMGKNINVPIFVCDELYNFAITDTHLGINGHKIVKDSIIRKLEEK